MSMSDWLHFVSVRSCCWEEDDARPPDGESPRAAALRLFRLPHDARPDESYDAGDSVFLRFGALVVCESPLGGSIHVICRRGAEKGWEPERVFEERRST